MKQLYFTWITRKYRGDMTLLQYHKFRLNNLIGLGE